MAKKERLANLLDSVGQEPQQDEKVASNKPSAEKKTTKAGEAALQAKAEELEERRKENAGRPTGGRKNSEPKDRATFVVSKEITRKLKYIAIMDTKLYQEVIAEALTSYIDQWEEENGTVAFSK